MFSGGVLRALGYRWEETRQLPAGIATTSPAAPTYDPQASLAAFAVFPWVRACINAIADDLSGLPLVLHRGDGPSAVRIESHPVLDLLAQPTRDLDRVAWESQVLTYWLPTGSCTLLLVGPPGRPSSLLPLHPERVRIIPDAYGQVAGVEYQPGAGAAHHYGRESIAILRSSSWRPGEQELVGEGLISALHDDLTAERGVTRMTARQAKNGRPDVILSPADDKLTLTKEQREDVAAAYGLFAASGRPALVLGGNVKAEFPTYTAHDMEFAEQRELTRETVLAVFGVPPARVGLPNANYATANQQAETYWEGLKAKATRVDAMLTAIARGWDASLTVSHDFGGVAALQSSRTARLERTVTWYSLGADAAAAAAYEGFAESPLLPAGAAAKAVPADDAGRSALRRLFAAPPIRIVRAPIAVPADDAGRSALWRSWLDAVHTPSERTLAVATNRALSAQLDRVLGRLSESPQFRFLAGQVVTRDVLSEVIAALFPAAAEDAAMRDALRSSLASTIRAGYADGADQLGESWTLDTPEGDPLVESRLASLVTHVDPTTQARIRRAVSDGLDAGDGVNGIADRIRRCGAFSPSRSLAIARTEATRSLSGGHDAAYARMAEVEGVAIYRAWLSARDSETREAHAILDGQVRAIGEQFRIESGEFAGSVGMGPGEFTEAALVVNCRCTTYPTTEAA